MSLNEMYSYNDFTGQDLTGRPASEFNNSTIIGASFAQEGAIDVDVLPAGVVNCTIQRSNMCNVNKPAGFTFVNCATDKILKQNDLHDWKVTAQRVPTIPLRKKEFEGLGLSIDPNDIPESPMSKDIVTDRKDKLINYLQKRIDGIVLTGGWVIEDTDSTYDLDVKITPGTAITKDGKIRIQKTLSRDIPMIRHFITNGARDSDTAIEIDTTKYVKGQGLVPTNSGKWYRSIFYITSDNKINWRYPKQEFETLEEAQAHVDASVSHRAGYHILSTALITQGSSGTLPSLQSGQWIDLRQKVNDLIPRG